VPGSRAAIPIRNRAEQDASLEAELLVSPDALALVRFGLRAPDDQRILNTVAAIDAVSSATCPPENIGIATMATGMANRRMARHSMAPASADFGRSSPGSERINELAKGRPDETRRLLGALEASASPGGLLPEQIWDGDDIPALELFLGRPSEVHAACLGPRRTH